MKNKFCLVCGKELTKKQVYNHQQCCSPQCSAKNPIKKQRMKKTIKEKYGVEHFSKSNQFNKKIRNTWNKKSKEQIDAFNENCQKTHLERYGCKRPLQKLQFKEKAKQTNLEKYGVQNPFQVQSIKEKIKETNLEKYGVDNPQKSLKIINKTKKSFRKKFIKKLIEKVNNYVIPLFNENEYDNIRNKYRWKCIKCGNEFEQNIHKNQINGKIEYVPRCLNCYPHLYGYSFLEKELVDFIKSIYNGEIITNNRKILKGKELDIVLPELNLAIEFNGIYWHSLKEKYYHLNKTEQCQKLNIRLIHIFEHEWKNKKQIVKILIKSLLNFYDKKIDAYDCNVKEIYEVNHFINKYSLIDMSDYNKFYGLFYEKELISILMVNKDHLMKIVSNMSYDIDNVVTRLLDVFPSRFDGNLRIQFDRRYENGEKYKELELIEETQPQLIKINNYKIYDCGKLIYKIKEKKMNTKKETNVIEKISTELPGKYHVILHNDDVTPMGFVVEILVNIFSFDRQKAVELMLEIHNKGKGIAGTYIKSIAESKTTLVRDVSFKADYPLNVTIEKA